MQITDWPAVMNIGSLEYAKHFLDSKAGLRNNSLPAATSVAKRSLKS
ncbi:hypothetical protein J2R62_18965 [Plesiomonas shigelloides]|uniref:Uncharacterized protein n=1 Tax=Plesiomonas shigelloides TaxID=703 RepID=A0A8I1W977_PLESH|nr:hypothetical protein [Plesiomonas shigelloides]MBO1110189.1 hypothetical protein [Plesiomonas shigelloides]